MLLPAFSFGQEVISTQGDSYSNASGSIDFTFGEVVINTASNGTNDLTQGFHQTNWNFLGVEDNAPDLDVTVYPNPSSEVLNIKTSSFEGVEYSLIDSKGNIVRNGELSQNLTTIQVDQLASGNYTLSLSEGGNDLKTITLLKTR